MTSENIEQECYTSTEPDDDDGISYNVTSMEKRAFGDTQRWLSAFGGFRPVTRFVFCHDSKTKLPRDKHIFSITMERSPNAGGWLGDRLTEMMVSLASREMLHTYRERLRSLAFAHPPFLATFQCMAWRKGSNFTILTNNQSQTSSGRPVVLVTVEDDFGARLSVADLRLEEDRVKVGEFVRQDGELRGLFSRLFYAYDPHSIIDHLSISNLSD